MENEERKLTVKDVIEEFSMENCNRCSWDKHCIKPSDLTPGEVKRRREKEKEDMKQDKTGKNGMGVVGAMISMMMDDGFSRPKACPLFMQRLRKSPELCEKIKKIMMEWKD